MSRLLARQYDKTFGFCSVCKSNRDGEVTEGSPDVFCEDQKVARVGDLVTATCGHTGLIDSGASDVLTNDKKTARINDTFSGVYTGEIIESAKKTYWGK